MKLRPSVAVAGALATALAGGALYQTSQSPTTLVLSTGQEVPGGWEKQVGKYKVAYQGDGNLVVYSPAGPVWASDTQHEAGRLAMQGDGNLVIYNRAGAPVWASNTSGASPRLVLEGDRLRIQALAEVWKTPVFASSGEQPPPPPPPATSFKPLRLSESKRWFRTDDGLFDWREVSAFSLQSRMLRGEDEQVRLLLREYKAIGFTVTRVLLTLGGDYWEGRAGSPLNYSLRSCPDGADYWSKLDTLLDMHAQEGLRTRLVVYGALECFGGVWDPTGRRDIYQGEVRRKAEAFTLELVTRLRDQQRTHVQLELANEPNQIGMRDSSRALRDLGRRVKQVWPGVMLNMGDVNGMDFADAFDGAFDAVDRHVDRNPGLRFIEADKRMGEDAYRDEQPRALPAISGEPKNMGELRLDGRNSDVAVHPVSAYSYGAVTRSRQILPNFHYDGGLWTTPIKPETVRSMQAFHQALNAFPMLDAGRFRGHWSEAQGNWWKRDPYPASDDVRAIEAHVNNGRGPWRVFGLGDFAVAFPYRPGANVLGWTNRPATVVDRFADDLYEVAIVRRNP